MRAKYKQPHDAQSEVTCTSTHLLPHLEPNLIIVIYCNHQHRHHRVVSLRSRDGMALLQSVSCARGSVRDACTHTLAGMHTRTSTRSDEFVFATLDRVPYASHQHLAELL